MPRSSGVVRPDSSRPETRDFTAGRAWVCSARPCGSWRWPHSLRGVNCPPRVVPTKKLMYATGSHACSCPSTRPGSPSPEATWWGGIVINGGELDQLRLDPTWRGRGLGDQFTSLAKNRQPDGLALWATRSTNRRTGSLSDTTSSRSGDRTVDATTSAGRASDPTPLAAPTGTLWMRAVNRSPG